MSSDLLSDGAKQRVTSVQNLLYASQQLADIPCHPVFGNRGGKRSEHTSRVAETTSPRLVSGLKTETASIQRFRLDLVSVVKVPLFVNLRMSISVKDAAAANGRAGSMGENDEALADNEEVTFPLPLALAGRVTKGSLEPADSRAAPPAEEDVERRVGRMSSGEKAVNVVSGVFCAEPSPPLEE